MKIYAIKGDDNDENKIKVFDSLRGGVGRFGWSYIETANMIDLQKRYEKDGWDSLLKEEKDCYHEFLLRIKPGDYVVYVNVPEWGKCTLAKVTGEYYFDFNEGDFNHRFLVSPESVQDFDRRDARVPPPLYARLKLRGRWWTIYTEDEFKELLDYLETGTEPKERTPETNLQHLSRYVKPHLLEITEKIHKSHPGKDLEDFIERIFKKFPGVKSVIRKTGPADKGADLLVYFENDLAPGLLRKDTLAVQVKSYEGEHIDPSAVDDIKRAFEHYEEKEEISMGLIISTANKAGRELEIKLENLQESSGKPVAFMCGAELAKFFLKYAGDIC